MSWHDGICKSCGSETFGGDAYTTAPPEVKAANNGFVDDYYVWCSNSECQHHIGTMVGDQECPPEWAEHDDDTGKKVAS